MSEGIKVLALVGSLVLFVAGIVLAYHFLGKPLQEIKDEESAAAARLLTQHPVSEPWRPDATLVTAELPIPIQGIVPLTNNCQVGELVGQIVEGQGQGQYFKALVIPFKEVPKGSKIQVYKISYTESFTHSVSFLIVK